MPLAGIRLPGRLRTFAPGNSPLRSAGSLVTQSAVPPTVRILPNRGLATVVPSPAPLPSLLLPPASAASNPLDEARTLGNDPSVSGQSSTSDTLRRNHVGIQMISPALYNKVFPGPVQGGPNPGQVEKARRHLQAWNLLDKALEPLPDVQLPVPDLVGHDIYQHFNILGQEQSSSYLDKATRLAERKIPPLPKEWVAGRVAEGWMRYDTRNPHVTPRSVEAPTEDALVFDVEVLYKLSDFPVMAVAVSEKFWYAWVAPGLFSHSAKEPFVPKHLVPLGSPEQDRIIVGHHVAYDRARIAEEYDFVPTRSGFIDTMSMHCAVGGLSSQQRPSFLAKRKSDKENQELSYVDGRFQLPEGIPKIADWTDHSSMNNLKMVAELHLSQIIDKGARGAFDTEDPQTIIDDFQNLMNYCANDVKVTHDLHAVLLPKFLKKCPHPASFAGMMHMGKGYLPVSSDWSKYVNDSDAKYDECQEGIHNTLSDLVDKAVDMMDGEKWRKDPWLVNLDWSTREVRMTKPKISAKGVVVDESRPYKVSRNTYGKPKWFSDIQTRTKNTRITLSMRIAPYLLRLKWKGFPVYASASYGWTYVVPQKVSHGQSGDPLQFDTCPGMKNYDPRASEDEENYYYRIPHPGGLGKNCGSPLTKSFNSAFEDGTLTSEYPDARRVLDLHAQCTYWTGSRQRVHKQFIMWKGKEMPARGISAAGKGKDYGVILPQSVVMGTVTRRAVEPTWMTAANAKKNRIGTELKSLVQAPKGYKIIGADVDSEELWIASLLGDAQFKMHGATAIGFMTLQGTKKQKTDLHSVTGDILGISRNHAKVFNYARIYGAGLKHAIQLLLQNSPGMKPLLAKEKAEELYRRTKGGKHKCAWSAEIPKVKKDIWYGGSETFMFNQLEAIAVSAMPTTPVLKCEIPDSLMPQYVQNKYMTSRVNWVVQSSGVDYLHLLLVSMDYLMRRLKIDGRFMVSIHDEIRFLVKDEQSLLAALCLQVSNLWVRAAFAASLNIDDVPASAAFFSAVDIDTCLRKEVDMDCVTPSNPNPIPSGQSLDIYDITAKLPAGPVEFWGCELPGITNLQKSLPVTAPTQEACKGLDMSDARVTPQLKEAVQRVEEVKLQLEEARLEIQMAQIESEVTKLETEMVALFKEWKNACSQARKMLEASPNDSETADVVQTTVASQKSSTKRKPRKGTAGTSELSASAETVEGAVPADGSLDQTTATPKKRKSTAKLKVPKAQNSPIADESAEADSAAASKGSSTDQESKEVRRDPLLEVSKTTSNKPTRKTTAKTAREIQKHNYCIVDGPATADAATAQRLPTSRSKDSKKSNSRIEESVETPHPIDASTAQPEIPVSKKSSSCLPANAEKSDSATAHEPSDAIPTSIAKPRSRAKTSIPADSYEKQPSVAASKRPAQGPFYRSSQTVRTTGMNNYSVMDVPVNTSAKESDTSTSGDTLKSQKESRRNSGGEGVPNDIRDPFRRTRTPPCESQANAAEPFEKAPVSSIVDHAHEAGPAPAARAFTVFEGRDGKGNGNLGDSKASSLGTHVERSQRLDFEGTRTTSTRGFTPTVPSSSVGNTASASSRV
ncbi:DNA-directed DNA polymerase gamma mip1 [Thoreauomyces humboldtii]|nr:DNA-directed DNA polymerase gamma mip1 [Thoreauomyces humboldtii]